MAAPSLAEASARTALAALTRDFRELGGEITSEDALCWRGYGPQIQAARNRSGESESVVCGRGLVGSVPAILIAFDFGFLGGSMGEGTGERIVRALRAARAAGLPVVSLIASGGARIQEGMRALFQMQRIAKEIAANREEGIFHLAVLRNPTTGGVWASLAAAADVIIALDGASVAFAGRRVRGDTADGEAFSAAGKYTSGCADALVQADDAPAAVADWLALLHKRAPPRVCQPPGALMDGAADCSAWETVLAARSNALPRARAYLDAYLERRLALSGDRCGGVDEGMLCGLGRRGDQTVAYVAQTGNANTPAGFRTAHRTFELAERLRLPVLTLIDTPGAANDAAAERAGIGTALAELVVRVASLTVPVTTLVIGEGGSGGALAIAAQDNLWMLPTSYFSVISPEGAAAILHRDSGRADEVAEQLRLKPVELQSLGLTRGIVRSPEP